MLLLFFYGKEVEMKKNKDLRVEMLKREITITELSKLVNIPRPMLTTIINHFELADSEKSELMKKMERSK